MNLNYALATAIAALGLVVTAAPVLAAPAVASAAANVRTGPGTSYAKVDALFEGEEVDVGQCQAGWCYVQHDGADGWVSAQFLDALDDAGGRDEDDGPVRPPRPDRDEDERPRPRPLPPEEPEISFGFRFGPNGFFTFGIGQQPRPPRNVDAVCFYEGPNYGGAGLCVEPGTSLPRLRAWNDRISSIRVFGDAGVEVCSDYNFFGACAEISSNQSRLNSSLNNRISSLEAF